MRRSTDGHTVYIYGAKTVAERVCLTLTVWGIDVPAFIASERYENRSTICGRPVLALEQMETLPDCILVATAERFMPAIVEDLSQRDGKTLLLLREAVQEEFPPLPLRSEHCKIDEEAFVSDEAQIFADDTSEIIIDKGAEVPAGCMILASDHSQIHIGPNVILENCCRLTAEAKGGLQFLGSTRMFDSHIVASQISARTGGQITIGGAAQIREAEWTAYDRGAVSIGAHAQFAASECCVFSNGNVSFGDDAFLYTGGSFGARHGGKIQIGNHVDLGNTNLGCDGADIIIGDECMFGGNSLIMAGSHPIYSIKSQQEITNRRPVIVGNHVWGGAGVTYLSGCKIGDGSIVDTQAVVSKEIPANATCGGCPAQTIWRGIRWER